jgi:trk system potassium uptake protein TrkH
MGWFDAVTHAFATIAGGGFSTHNASIAYFNSAYVEGVVMVFMVAGATSFILHFHALRGNFNYFRNTAFSIFFWIIIIASLLVALNLSANGFGEEHFLNALRMAAFQVISVITTTGFATADFKFWPAFSVLILLLLMFVGGMSASTSGSIKVSRYEIIFKDIRRTLRKFISPRTVSTIWSNKRSVEGRLVTRVQIFALSYILIFVISGVLLVGLGYRPDTAFSAVAATLGNVGPGIGDVGPYDNFASFSALAKWILSADMLLGRLEIWTLLSLFVPEFWT